MWPHTTRGVVYMEPQPCPFLLLGVRATATKDEICKAWRRRMRTTHPDKHQGVDALEHSKVLNDAKERALVVLEESGIVVERQMKKKNSDATKKANAERQRAADTERQKVAAERRAAAEKRRAEETLMAEEKKKNAERQRALQQERDELYRQRMEKEDRARKQKENEIYARERRNKENVAMMTDNGQEKKKRERECVLEFVAHARGQLTVN